MKNLSQYKALSLNYYYYYYNHLRHHIWRLYSIKLELRIQSQLCHLLVVWPWACHLISLHFSHLWNGDNNSAYHIMFSEGLIEVLPMEYLGQCLTHCKCLVSIIIISLWTPWIRDHHVIYSSPLWKWKKCIKDREQFNLTNMYQEIIMCKVCVLHR